LQGNFRMSLWTEITNTALIGCERKPLSLNGSSGKLGALLGRLDQNDREGALFAAAALVSLYERAGSLSLKDEQPLPEACEPDDAPRCGERAAIHLAMMLRGEYKELLPEWLAKTAAAGRRAPEELLTPVLNTGRTWKDISEEFLFALGARGRWLAAQNPDWAYAVGGFDETLWETGSSEQRAAVLAELRKRDAARARELLASNWAQESPKDRAGFLEALKYGLNLDDEAFLEAALDDRRKEVRRVAVDLLTRLPESALRRRMIERVRPLIIFKLNKLKRRTIEVTLPEACDKAMQRDGVEPKHYSRNVGEKSWWLQQMLSLIPPKVWPQESGWTISELIEAAKHSKWEKVLLDGWTQAALYCQDLEWAGALLDETASEKLQSLFQILPQARQEAFILRLLEADPALDTYTKPAYICIACCQRQWGEALSRAVIDSLVHTATKSPSNRFWIWTAIDDNIGHHLDPALIPEAILRLTEATKTLTERRAELEPFLNFIQFRHEMLKEF
jgi:Family of unknown function (DUF5691)